KQQSATAPAVALPSGKGRCLTPRHAQHAARRIRSRGDGRAAQFRFASLPHRETLSCRGVNFQSGIESDPMSGTEKESKNSIQVIRRMMKLLDVLAQSPNAVSLKVLAASAELHPATAHRILTAMVNDHMVERVDQGSYRLGMRLLELGNLVKSRISVREQALPLMRELHALTNEAVNLSVRRGDEIVYIERSSSGRQLMRVVNIIGDHAPLHITAVGKL